MRNYGHHIGKILPDYKGENLALLKNEYRIKNFEICVMLRFWGKGLKNVFDDFVVS